MARGGEWTAVRPAAGLSRLHPRCDRIGVLARNDLKTFACLAGPCFAVAAVGGDSKQAAARRRPLSAKLGLRPLQIVGLQQGGAHALPGCPGTCVWAPP